MPIDARERATGFRGSTFPLNHTDTCHITLTRGHMGLVDPFLSKIPHTKHGALNAALVD